MQERRAAQRFQINLNARWETLRNQGRGAICDLSSLGCFVLNGAEALPGELVRLEILPANKVISVWGHIVYNVNEIGFAVLFVPLGDDDRRLLGELSTGS